MKIDHLREKLDSWAGAHVRLFEFTYIHEKTNNPISEVPFKENFDKFRAELRPHLEVKLFKIFDKVILLLREKADIVEELIYNLFITEILLDVSLGEGGLKASLLENTKSPSAVSVWGVILWMRMKRLPIVEAWGQVEPGAGLPSLALTHLYHWLVILFRVEDRSLLWEATAAACHTVNVAYIVFWLLPHSVYQQLRIISS